MSKQEEAEEVSYAFPTNFFLALKRDNRRTVDLVVFLAFSSFSSFHWHPLPQPQTRHQRQWQTLVTDWSSPYFGMCELHSLTPGKSRAVINRISYRHCYFHTKSICYLQQQSFTQSSPANNFTFYLPYPCHSKAWRRWQLFDLLY